MLYPNFVIHSYHQRRSAAVPYDQQEPDELLNTLPQFWSSYELPCSRATQQPSQVQQQFATHQAQGKTLLNRHMQPREQPDFISAALPITAPASPDDFGPDPD
jgi:hypothetical protein